MNINHFNDFSVLLKLIISFREKSLPQNCVFMSTIRKVVLVVSSIVVSMDSNYRM